MLFKGYIVSMHEKLDKAGKAVAYFYQLQEKLSFHDVSKLSHIDEDEESLPANYAAEGTHWLAYWSSTCPLPGVTNDILARHPIKVQYSANSTTHHDTMQPVGLKNFRNINVGRFY